MFSTSTDGGASWSRAARRSSATGDRGYYSAPAISPNGTDVWLVYNAFTEPFKDSAEGPANDRPLDRPGPARDGRRGAVGAFAPVHRGASGDARGSSQNDLAAEFLGDYVYAAATRDYGMGVWNDVRDAADCPAIDEFRQELHDEAVATGQQTAEAEEPRGESEERERGRGGGARVARGAAGVPGERSATRTSSAGPAWRPRNPCRDGRQNVEGRALRRAPRHLRLRSVPAPRPTPRTPTRGRTATAIASTPASTAPRPS